MVLSSAWGVFVDGGQGSSRRPGRGAGSLYCFLPGVSGALGDFDQFVVFSRALNPRLSKSSALRAAEAALRGLDPDHWTVGIGWD